MRSLLIRVECSDESDCTWLRDKLVPAVEQGVEDEREDDRFDGEVVVSWEYED